jgi:acetyl-CoA acetyltransferase
MLAVGIINVVRTPVGRFSRALASVHPADLLRTAVMQPTGSCGGALGTGTLIER